MIDRYINIYIYIVANSSLLLLMVFVCLLSCGKCLLELNKQLVLGK